MASPFKEWASKYAAKGLSPLPLKAGEKRPVLNQWQKWCAQPVDPKTLADWIRQYGDCNIGLALGTEVLPGLHLIAIDVDADDMVTRVEHALNAREPAKVGKKGKTIAALCADPSNHKFRRSGAPAPSVEKLGLGSQTVMPPSIHPDTGRPYVWVGPSLLDTSLEQLPLATEWTFDEIQAHLAEKGEHIDALNTMAWLGVGGGGNTHDTCVAAVACFVSRGWPDVAILNRIKRAKQEACLRSGQEMKWPQADATIGEWIKSARDKGMTGSSAKGKVVPPERVMATWLYDHLGGQENLWARQGHILQYKDGHWPLLQPEYLRRIMMLQDPRLKHAEARNALAVLYDLVGGERQQDPQARRVCLANGTLDMKTGRLEQWDPGHRLLHQLPFAWEDGSRCPEYEALIQFVFNRDQEAIDVWEEFAALTLVDDMSYEKALFLLGNGANGKSTLTRILAGLHAPDAVSSISITDLGDERKRSSLVGKLVNISAEESRMGRIADAVLKKITGGDGVEIRYLYKEVQNNVRLSVRFIETVNDMPGTNDLTHSIRRRLVILDCPNAVLKPDRMLSQRIIAQERPGILARSVTALQRLTVREQFKIPRRSELRLEEYLLDQDPVRQWVMMRTEPWPRGAQSAELYADYKNWEQASGLSRFGKSLIEWGTRMTALGYPSEVRRQGKNILRCRTLRIRDGMESPI